MLGTHEVLPGVRSPRGHLVDGGVGCDPLDREFIQLLHGLRTLGLQHGGCGSGVSAGGELGQDATLCHLHSVEDDPHGRQT